MKCKCIKQINKQLSENNTQLTTRQSINFSTGKVTTHLLIETEKVDLKNRARKKNVMPSCCPFCGVYLAEKRKKK